jgi:beta-glucosidase
VVALRRLGPRNSTEHVPSFDHYTAKLADEGYTIKYAEGIQVGYRHPNAEKIALWQFGFGLSYTAFDHSGLALRKVDDSISLSVRVKNTGI